MESADGPLQHSGLPGGLRCMALEIGLDDEEGPRGGVGAACFKDARNGLGLTRSCALASGGVVLHQEVLEASDLRALGLELCRRKLVSEHTEQPVGGHEHGQQLAALSPAQQPRP